MASTGCPLVADRAGHQAGQLRLVEVGHQPAALRLHAQHARELGRLEPDVGPVEGQRDRAGEGRIGELVEGVAHVGVVDVGGDLVQRELGDLLVLEVRRLQGRAGLLAVDLLAGPRLRDLDPAAAEPDGSVARRVPKVALSRSTTASIRSSSTVTTGSTSSGPV